MRKFYALTLDGQIIYLGVYDVIEDVMEEYPDDIAWYFDEQSAIEMASDILNVMRNTKDI